MVDMYENYQHPKELCKKRFVFMAIVVILMAMKFTPAFFEDWNNWLVGSTCFGMIFPFFASFYADTSIEKLKDDNLSETEKLAIRKWLWYTCKFTQEIHLVFFKGLGTYLSSQFCLYLYDIHILNIKELTEIIAWAMKLLFGSTNLF